MPVKDVSDCWLAGGQSTRRGPSSTSRALAVKVTAAPVGPVASVWMLPGTVITGAAVSASWKEELYVSGDHT